MKPILVAFLITGFCAQLLSAQTSGKAAEENPLAAVYYLLSSTDKDDNEDEKACLAGSLAGVGKLPAAEKTIGMVEVDSYVDRNFIAIAESLLKKGKVKEASNFTSVLLKRFADDDYSLSGIVGLLVKLGRDEEALKIIRRLNGEEKIDAYFDMADAYMESGQRPRAALIMDFAFDPAIDLSGGRGARFGLYLARFGQGPEALEIAQKSLKGVVWTSGIPEREDGGIIDRVFDTYLLLGKYDLAWQMLERQQKTNDPASLIQIAESYLARGNTQKARELLTRTQGLLDPKEYGDSFALRDLVEIYVKLGEMDKAVEIAKSLSGSEYMRQKTLLLLADRYIAGRNNAKALEILNFAIEQAAKVDISEEESGSLWSSGRWEQAQYQSAVASRFITMRRDAQALNLIAKIKKPYLRAALLSEFVIKHHGRISPAVSKARLQEALVLLRTGEEEIFDANKYSTYASIAETFARIRMPSRADEIFSEVLSKDQEMYDKGLEGYLLTTLCNIGVAFERSGIKPTPKTRASLRKIITTWENDGY